MTKSVTTMIAVLALASGLSAQTKKADAQSLTGTWNKGLQGGHDPIGVPDSFVGHVKLIFDLQVLAFPSDITRVFAFKLSRDNLNRSYPESRFTSDSN